MTTQARSTDLEVLSTNVRRFPPSSEVAQAANAQAGIYAEAESDWQGFWAKWARKLEWIEPFKTVLEWNEPFAKWFPDGKLNASVNCLDRHVKAGLGDKVAFFFEGEPGDRSAITYRALLDDVCRFANGLRALGIKKGDRVAIYMPMIPELPVAMLACARIGATHSVIFGGFSPDAIVDRVRDSQCVAIITTDRGWRRGKQVPLKEFCDDALSQGLPSVRNVIVSKRVGAVAVDMQKGRDVWWDDVIAGQPATCEPEVMDAEDLLFLLYTSGTTAKPKGIKHSTAGYLTGVSTTHELVFDLKPDDVYWCTADIGWVTGHSYIVYGPLCNGATGVLFEGTPDYPGKNRFWDIVERYGVTILYTAPTAIRTFMKWGEEFPRSHNLSSLRLLGSVGEPINPEAWMWYHEVIGGGRCPIVDTFWQTETGMIMITPLPGVTTLKPGSATKPFPGVSADIVNEAGETVSEGGGYAVFKRPWPAMLRGIYGDDERYFQTYWSKFPHMYLIGDGCTRDADGDFWFMGRIDDVMNISGHRISTAEVESAFVDHPRVAEAAVIGKNDDVTGQAIVAYVTLRGGEAGTHDLANELRMHVANKLGKFVTPKYITFTPELPKTRSGKIMRRLLRDITEGRTIGDTTTVADSAIVAELQERAKAAPTED